ncbi:MAG: hypothetical protein BWY75_00670 [bacterium ADurb.Bin425]|nr:MAG: hypothetical protein BWY75_00670 [bacterium ADurb.Bin425]
MLAKESISIRKYQEVSGGSPFDLKPKGVISKA